MQFKVKEVKGLKSLRAYNAYSALLLGLTMLPAYNKEHYESFLKRVDAMPTEDQETLIREATRFVNLDNEDVQAMLLFCTDKNGVPIAKENIDNFNPLEIIEAIVAVSMEILKIKIDLVTESEKKN